MKLDSLKKSINHLRKLNRGNYYLNYMIEEGSVSESWYKAILKEVLKDKPKRVIDIGSGVNLFGYLFANEGIEYIGIDRNQRLNPIESKNIKFIHSDYYDIKDKFRNDICISCLCVGYLIPVEDILCKKLITNQQF